MDPCPPMRTVLALLGSHHAREEAMGVERFSELLVHTFNTHFCRGTSLGGRLWTDQIGHGSLWGVTNDHVIKVPGALKWPAWLCQPEGGS